MGSGTETGTKSITGENKSGSDVSNSAASSSDTESATQSSNTAKRD